MSPESPEEARDELPSSEVQAPAVDEAGAESPFPIVGVGASAGGLEAFTQLLGQLPKETGMAFVLVQHLDPRHESRLTDLLARATHMPVVEASQGREVAPDRVYIIPPNTNMAIGQGMLLVTPRGEGHGPHLPVDHFLRALARAQQDQAIGVVLSGTGSDGTLGLLEVKASGGITFAQEPSSARHGGMPQSAIGSGAVDFVLPPEEIARRLAEIGAHPYLAPIPGQEPPAETQDHFRQVLDAVKAATRVDFTQYRDSTIRRRVMRRMALHGESSLSAYAGRLERDAREVEALYRDLLIHVTSFFRDPALFEVLKTDVFPAMIEAKPADAPLRLWVPGCSTGQEAYSLAIALWEFFDGKPVRRPYQIFATDLSDPGSLERARAGLYPESIEAELTPERLHRFFKKEDHLYRIDKSIRDSCIFARQNLTADPPFSHVDLISCRNVLIYLVPALQRHILSTFHYALNVPGFLVLGGSETVGGFSGFFEARDRTHKIYVKQVMGSRPLLQFAVEDYKARGPPGPRSTVPGSASVDFQKEADRVLLNCYAPPGVLVDEQLEILQFRGRTGPYLEAPPGEPTLNLLKVARPGLFVELRSAVNEAQARGQPVRREDLRLRDENGPRTLAIEVVPVRPREAAVGCYLVLFEEDGRMGAPAAPEPIFGWRARLHRWLGTRAGSPPEITAPHGSEAAAEGEIEQLRQELSSTREYLQSLNEQQDAANEELRSANEEILSANEELQSINEELETAKEELQSTNEELSTVNEQLHHRNLELNQTTNDLQNLLASTTIPVVMAGPDLRIRRLTPPARKIMNLLPSDVGRPIGDLKSNVDLPDLERLIAEVIDEVQIREREVRDREGRWYLLRIHPYRTADNKIDGAVVLLLDIDDLKRTEASLRESEERFRRMADTAPVLIWMSGPDKRCTYFNKPWLEFTGRSLEQELGDGWADGVHPGDRVRCLGTYVAAFDARRPFEIEYRLRRHDSEYRWIVNAGVPRLAEGGGFAGYIGSCIDITDRKRMEQALRDSEERLSLVVDGAGMGTWDVDLASGHAIWSETHFRILGYEPVPNGAATLEMGERCVHPEDRERVARALAEARRERTLYAPEYRILRADTGEIRWLAVFGRFLYDGSGAAQRFVGIFHDISERREAKAMTHQASHDALTGLANRTEFERRLERVLAGADPRDPHALLFLDLDQFKLVNDTCGHAAGDALLRQIPSALERPLRKRDTLARLGGDEFGVLLEHCPGEHALRIARELVLAVQDFPFAWEDQRFTVGASVGLVAIPGGGDTLAAVMSAADRACYAAKEKGRNRVHVYEASDEDLQQRQGQMQWIPRLHSALAGNRFRLYAQPVVALKDHDPEIAYSEVLLRLVDEREGLLMPGAFIPAAERYQQMRSLDRWVVRTALADLAARDASVSYGINVSAQSLSDPGFLDFLLERLEGAAPAPGQICFEITETAAITDLKNALRFMEALKARGCRFALDDFGSGFASFGYLKTLPVDYLKIDGHFVKDIPEDPYDDAVVEAIQRIAGPLGLKTIAESVESEAILTRVKIIGIDFAQGYTLAEPKPLMPGA